MKHFFISTLMILFFSVPFQLLAQQQPDITGVWKGELIKEDSVNVHLPYEIAVSEEKGNLKGYSRIIFTVDGKEEPGIEDITLKWKGKELVVEDEGFIEHNFSINPPKRVKKTLILTLKVTDTEMILSGTWNTNKVRYYIPAYGTVVLKRRVDFKESPLFKRLDTLKIAEKLSFTQPQKITTPVVAVVAPPVEKKPAPLTPDEPVPVPEPEFILPAIGKTTFIASLPIIKTKQPALVKVSGPSRQKKMQLEALAKTTIKYTPKAEPAPAVVKEEPVVAAAPQPKPEKKPAPVVVKPVPAPVEKKPAEVVTASQPKPVPPPASKPTAPPVAVIAPSATQGAAELEKRTTKSEKEVFFEQDSMTLTLYDNGDVDGDVVTVLMNGNIIFSKQMLTTKANTKTIYVAKDLDSVKLVMYAENLGDIPPNTGLLIVMDGEKRFEVRFSADLQTNAAIMLRRKKKE